MATAHLRSVEHRAALPVREEAGHSAHELRLALARVRLSEAHDRGEEHAHRKDGRDDELAAFVLYDNPDLVVLELPALEIAELLELFLDHGLGELAPDQALQVFDRVLRVRTLDRRAHHAEKAAALVKDEQRPGQVAQQSEAAEDTSGG